MRRALAAWLAVAGAACAGETFVAPPTATDGSTGSSDSGGAPDASGGAACGGRTCAAGEACCVTALDPGSLASVFRAKATGTCLRPVDCAPPRISVGCDTPTACGPPTSICCVTHDPNAGAFTSADCVLAGSCDVAGPHDILCDPASGTVTCPSSSSTCSARTTTVHYDVYGICH